MLNIDAKGSYIYDVYKNDRFCDLSPTLSAKTDNRSIG